MPYVFDFQSTIPFPVVVILKLKTLEWCARQQRLQTPQVTGIPQGPAREGNPHSSDFTKSLLGLVLNTKLMYHPYTGWLAWMLSKFKRKNHRNQK